MAKPLTVFAIVAHPDDIEFEMAGTLLLLKDGGADIHMMNVANGCYGSMTLPPPEIARIRWQEAQDAASVAGATMHPPITDDLAVFYDAPLLAKVSAVVREVQPDIVLTHSPQDYMEDHMNTCRLAVSAAFAHGVPNYVTDPPVKAWSGDVTVYHAMPHGLRDGLRRRIQPGQYVDITTTLDRKRNMLAQHRSQKEWLDATQGMDSYLAEMEKSGREVGKMSGRYEVAEGFRRHSHLGFSTKDIDPLQIVLGDKCWVDPDYEVLT